MYQDCEVFGSEGECRYEVTEEDSEGINLQEPEHPQVEAEERGTGCGAAAHLLPRQVSAYLHWDSHVCSRVMEEERH